MLKEKDTYSQILGIWGFLGFFFLQREHFQNDGLDTVWRTESIQSSGDRGGGRGLEEVENGRESLHSNAANPVLATNGILIVAGSKRQEERNNK